MNGIDNYLCKVWIRTSSNIFLTLFTGIVTMFLMAESILSVTSNTFLYVMISSTICSFYAIIKFHMTAPVYNRDAQGNNYLAECQSNRDREKWSNVIFLMMGIIISPALFEAIEYDILIRALVVTTLATVGPIMASLNTTNSSSLLQYRSSVHTMLTGFLFLSLGGIFFPVLHEIELYGGVLFFAFLNAYDTHVAIQKFRQGEADHVGHAINYALNILNILIRVIEILIRMKREDERKSR